MCTCPDPPADFCGQCPGLDYSKFLDPANTGGIVYCIPDAFDCGPNAILYDKDCAVDANGDPNFEVCQLCPPGTQAFDSDGDGCEDKVGPLTDAVHHHGMAMVTMVVRVCVYQTVRPMRAVHHHFARSSSLCGFDADRGAGEQQRQHVHCGRHQTSLALPPPDQALPSRVGASAVRERHLWVAARDRLLESAGGPV